MDNHLFCELYKRYEYKLDKFFQAKLRILTQDISISKDLMQETFLNLLHSSAYKNNNIKNFGDYIMVVAFNTWSDYVKKDKLKKRFQNELECFILCIIHSRKTFSENEIENWFPRIEKAIDKLPTEQQVQAMKFRIKNHSYEDIATEMGITKSQVRSILYRAKKKLPELVGIPNCEKEGQLSFEKLLAFYRGELVPEEKQECLHHLAECKQCKNSYNAIKAFEANHITITDNFSHYRQKRACVNYLSGIKPNSDHRKNLTSALYYLRRAFSEKSYQFTAEMGKIPITLITPDAVYKTNFYDYYSDNSRHSLMKLNTFGKTLINHMTNKNYLSGDYVDFIKTNRYNIEFFVKALLFSKALSYELTYHQTIMFHGSAETFTCRAIKYSFSNREFELFFTTNLKKLEIFTDVLIKTLNQHRFGDYLKEVKFFKIIKDENWKIAHLIILEDKPNEVPSEVI